MNINNKNILILVTNLGFFEQIHKDNYYKWKEINIEKYKIIENKKTKEMRSNYLESNKIEYALLYSAVLLGCDYRLAKYLGEFK